MIIKSNDFFKQIQQQSLGTCYLLHGEEEYAKQQALNQLIETTDEAVRDFNVVIASTMNAAEFIESCEVLPVMASKRIIICKCEDWFKKTDDDVTKVIEYLSQSNPLTCIVFVIRGKADARSALYKAIDKNGAVVLFDYYTEREAAQWASQYAKRKGYMLSETLSLELVKRVSVDVGKIAQELDKLCDYAGRTKTITKEMIVDSVMPDVEYTVFEMLEYFIQGNIAKGMLLLNETILREGPGSLFMLISFFAGRIRNMWIGKIALERGESVAQAQKLIGGNPYAAKKSLQAAQNFTLKALEETLLSLATLDQQTKQGQVKARPIFESILLSLFMRNVLS